MKRTRNLYAPHYRHCNRDGCYKARELQGKKEWRLVGLGVVLRHNTVLGDMASSHIKPFSYSCEGELSLEDTCISPNTEWGIHNGV